MFPFSFLSVMAAGVMAQEGGEVGPLGGKGRGKVKGKEACPRFFLPPLRTRKGKAGEEAAAASQTGRKEGGHCFLKTGSVNIATARVSYVRTYWVGAHSTHKTGGLLLFVGVCAQSGEGGAFQ